jgi:predicted deacetylase
MTVHVSIHDVSPAWQHEIELALELSHAIGCKPALLVVPNFHGEHPLAESPKFGAFLQKLQDEGHEIYLHGYFHAAGAPRLRDDARPGSAASKWFAQRVVSGGEAEFSDVSEPEARARLDEGQRALEALGLRVDGFIPPAWSMPRWVHRLLAERNVRFTEDHMRVYDPASGRSRASVVLNYASRTPGRLLSSVAYCRLAKYARLALPARIAIHPADMRFSLLRHEVKALLAWAEGDTVARGVDLLS